MLPQMSAAGSQGAGDDMLMITVQILLILGLLMVGLVAAARSAQLVKIPSPLRLISASGVSAGPGSGRLGFARLELGNRTCPHPACPH